ncbi:MAG: siphovirus ReqiPepy6 Gp37-like family protein [Firmicutes bacterium]|nr:siphovirus ReqiPepy6 Gp37-like family protein [Bacillota bacterium]
MIKEFDIYVYTRDLELIGIIDFFSSLRWRRKYYESGEFELHIPLNSQTEKYLKKDNLIIRDDAIEVGIIESFTINDAGDDGVEVIIYGRFLSSILDRRIIKSKINFSGKILLGERKILNEMTPFSKLLISEATLDSDSVVFQVSYKNVYEYLVTLAKISSIAHRISVDIPNKKMIYENYQGLDRTETQSINPRYEFSEDKSNIDVVDYTYSAKTEKNYVLVGGQGEDKNRIMVEVTSGNNKDFDLRETFVDAKSENQGDLTLAQYKETLKTKGSEKLVESTETLEVTVYADDYKKLWDLGDIVNIKKESWGIVMKQRITEIEETIENNNQKIFATFGTPFVENLTINN